MFKEFSNYLNYLKRTLILIELSNKKIKIQLKMASKIKRPTFLMICFLSLIQIKLRNSFNTAKSAKLLLYGIRYLHDSNKLDTPIALINTKNDKIQLK